jgi:argininosuccinate lyase
MESKVSRRLKQAPAKEILQYIYLPRLNREFSSTFEQLTQINLAHLLMLHKQNIVDKNTAILIAKALLKMQKDGPGAVELDPEREDAFFNYERHLIELVGQDVGGRLHTARSRNDIAATIDRMLARDFVTRIGKELAELVDAALNQAEKFAYCVMPGYTHLQAAQPITFGYYLSAVADAWIRDLDRLLHVLETAEGCSMGACALAGTSFPIDRHLTGAMLGFARPVANSLDAVASRDFALELSAALSILMITCSRMSQDFYIWSTPEFGYVSFPDSIAGTSSIMPQKKNPVVLEHMRGKTGYLIGLTSAIFSTVKSTHFSHHGDSSRESARGCWESCEEALKSVELMKLLVENVEPIEERMLSQAAVDFSTVTDLADLLVRKADISFRDAHHIIGAVVRNALDRGMPANEITPEMIDSAADEQLGRRILLEKSDLAECMNPVSNVAARKSYGAPSPRLVLEHIEEQRLFVKKKEATIETVVQRVREARNALSREIDALVSS